MKTAAGKWKIDAALPCIWLSPPHPHHPLRRENTGQGRFCAWSGGGGILIWCAAYDGSNCLIKSGIFIRVHGHWVVGILMWHWLDVHSNRLVQKEGLHGEQDKGRYEKQDKAMDDWSRLFFSCTDITERTGLPRTSSGSCFLLCVTGWVTPWECTRSSPAFIPSTFPPNGDFGPVQVRGGLQYVLLMSSTACIEPRERAPNYCDATNPLLLKTRARKSKDDIWSALILHEYLTTDFCENLKMTITKYSFEN